MHILKKNIVLVFSILLAAGLLYLLFWRTGSKVLLSGVQNADWRFSVAAFVLYAAVNMLRAYRFRLTLGGRLDFGKMTGIAFVHNFLTNLLPFRTGELSYPYLLRRHGFVLGGESTASLVVSRLFDVFIVANLILISFVVVLAKLAISGESKNILWLVAGFFFLIPLLFVFFIEWLLSFVKRFFLLVRFERFRAISFLFKKIDEARQVFLLVKDKYVFLRLVGLSFLIWAGNFWVGGLLVRGVGITVSFWQVVFMFAFPMILSEISPVQSFANLGIYEWSLVGGMALLGISRDTAAAASLSVHIQEILFAGIVAFFGMMILWFDAAKSNQENI